MGKICETIVDLYNKDGIISEPAGALSISSLDLIDKSLLENQIVVCILSGGNNDINRYPEIVDKMLRYKKLKQYYIIEFVQKSGELKKFINKILGNQADIVHFEYIKKSNINNGKVLIGIELINQNDYIEIEHNFNKNNINYINITNNDLLYSYIV